MWHKRWKEVGVFCVLYSARAAHCASGDSLSGDPDYADDVDDGVDDGVAAPGVEATDRTPWPLRESARR